MDRFKITAETTDDQIERMSSESLRGIARDHRHEKRLEKLREQLQRMTDEQLQTFVPFVFEAAQELDRRAVRRKPSVDYQRWQDLRAFLKQRISVAHANYRSIEFGSGCEWAYRDVFDWLSEGGQLDSEGLAPKAILPAGQPDEKHQKWSVNDPEMECRM